MVFDHTVKVNGVYYKAGEEVNIEAVGATQQPVSSDGGKEEKKPARKGRPKKNSEE